MKRLSADIKVYDYNNEESYKKHKAEMYEKGYREMNEMFGGSFRTGHLEGSDKFSWTASYIKSEGV